MHSTLLDQITHKLPPMMHQIQFHIVQHPTSQLHPIPVNATKLIKKLSQWGTVQSTRKGRWWLGIKNKVNYVYRNSEIKMPANVLIHMEYQKCIGSIWKYGSLVEVACLHTSYRNICIKMWNQRHQKQMYKWQCMQADTIPNKYPLQNLLFIIIS